MGLVHNLLMQFFSQGSSKIKVSETHVFDMVTNHNDHPSDVKHVFGSIYVLFTLFGCALLGVDSLQGGLAEGNRLHWKQRRMPQAASCLAQIAPKGRLL